MKGNRLFWIAFIASGVVATVGALPMFDVGLSDRFVILDFPGIVLSVIIAHNAHAFSATLSLFSSWAFYILLFIAVRKLPKLRHV